MAIRCLRLAALLLLAGCTSGPPAQYLGVYPGNLQVVRTSLKQVHRICRGNNINACSMRLDGYDCLIVLPLEFANDEQSKLYIHELAHCNGWPAGHPLR